MPLLCVHVMKIWEESVGFIQMGRWFVAFGVGIFLVAFIDFGQQNTYEMNPLKWTRLPNVSHFMCICRWVGRVDCQALCILYGEELLMLVFFLSLLSFLFPVSLISLNLHHLICGSILSGWPLWMVKKRKSEWKREWLMRFGHFISFIMSVTCVQNELSTAEVKKVIFENFTKFLLHGKNPIWKLCVWIGWTDTEQPIRSALCRFI